MTIPSSSTYTFPSSNTHDTSSRTELLCNDSQNSSSELEYPAAIIEELLAHIGSRSDEADISPGKTSPTHSRIFSPKFPAAVEYAIQNLSAGVPIELLKELLHCIPAQDLLKLKAYCHSQDVIRKNTAKSKNLSPMERWVQEDISVGPQRVIRSVFQKRLER